MTGPLAHVGGLPAEETLPTLAPAACALALAARVMLARAGGRLLRRRSERPTSPSEEDTLRRSRGDRLKSRS